MNKLLKRFCWLSVLCMFCFLCFSCATTVNVKLTRPAQLDLNGAKTIAILPIKPNSYYKEYDTSVAVGRRVVVNTFYQIFDIKDPDEQLIIDTLHSQIENGLLKSPYIKLVSSDAVERSLKKGTLNPADVYLTGEVSYFDVDDRRFEEKRKIKEAKGSQKAEYEMVTYWRRDVTFNFRYQIVDSETEKVLGFNEFQCSNSSSKYTVRNSLPRPYSIIESDVKAAARRILQELQPYTVMKSITLLEAKTKDKAVKERMKAADELAENSQLVKAASEFSAIYEETGLVEAGYNAAILEEALGNLSKAESMMSELYAKTKDSRVADGLSDIRYEINQAKKLEKQIKATEGPQELDAIDVDDEDLDLDF